MCIYTCVVLINLLSSSSRTDAQMTGSCVVKSSWSIAPSHHINHSEGMNKAT